MLLYLLPRLLRATIYNNGQGVGDEGRGNNVFKHKTRYKWGESIEYDFSKISVLIHPDSLSNEDFEDNQIGILMDDGSVISTSYQLKNIHEFLLVCGGLIPPAISSV